MANYVLKFSHFYYHGNRGWYDINLNIGVKLPDLENPVWCHILGSNSCISRVLANFVLKLPKFRCRGQSEVNFNHTVKMFDLENPLFGAGFVALSLVLAEF